MNRFVYYNRCKWLLGHHKCPKSNNKQFNFLRRRLDLIWPTLLQALLQIPEFESSHVRVPKVRILHNFHPFWRRTRFRCKISRKLRKGSHLAWRKSYRLGSDRFVLARRQRFQISNAQTTKTQQLGFGQYWDAQRWQQVGCYRSYFDS